jgi:hypothetical protein
MAINRFEAAQRFRELETRLSQLGFLSYKQNAEFGSWAKDVEALLQRVLPEHITLMKDFDTASHVEPADIDALKELLARARSLLFLDADETSDRILTDAVRHAVDDTMQKSWWIRGCGIVLLLSAGLFIGGTWKIGDYQFNIEEEARRVREGITRTAETFQAAVLEEQNSLENRLATLTQRIDATLAEAERAAQARLQSLDSTIKKQTDRLSEEVDKQIREDIPIYVKSQTVRINQEIDRIISVELPQRVENQELRLAAATDEAIDKDLPQHLSEQRQRLTNAVSALITGELRSHFEVEETRISDAVSLYISDPLSQYFSEQTRLIDVAVDKIIADDLRKSSESAATEISNSARLLVNGPLLEALEAQKQMISTAAADWVGGPLTAHLELEKVRLTGEADRLRRTLWVGLTARLAELLLDEFREENQRIMGPEQVQEVNKEVEAGEPTEDR